MIVYCFRNKYNDKKYVGITTRSLRERVREHLRDAADGALFHKALLKYGIDGFEVKVIDSAESEEELRLKEIYWIDRFKSFAYDPGNHGYNSTRGGDGTFGLCGPLNPQYGVSVRERFGENFDSWKSKLSESAAKGENHRLYGVHPLNWMGEEKWESLKSVLADNWKGGGNPSVRNPKFGEKNPNFGNTWDESTRRNASLKHRVKLGDADVIEIRRLYASARYTQQQLADRYGIKRQTVSDVICGRGYKHVPNDIDYSKVRLVNEQKRLRRMAV